MRFCALGLIGSRAEAILAAISQMLGVMGRWWPLAFAWQENLRATSPDDGRSVGTDQAIGVHASHGGRRAGLGYRQGYFLRCGEFASTIV
jgi:hypothetical protein